MFGSDDYDDDMCTCPDCGARYYPEVGPPGHICAAGLARNRRESEAWEKRYLAGGKRVRITIVVECYASDEAISSALGMAEMDIVGHAKTGVPVTGEDDILHHKWAAKIENVR